MSLLRIWLAATAVALAAMAVWAFAPMLVLVALLIGVLGVLAWSMIRLAYWLRARPLFRRWRRRRLRVTRTPRR